jgi:uncharacterized protein DUF3667
MANGADRCLNCGADLHGPFCAGCGQRAVPPDPTVKELAGDAWQELTGYDGRIAATIRGLLRPGRLTIEYIRGHRATYLPPVRVYLIASLVYFVVAAAAPPTPARRAGEVNGPVGIRLGLWSTSNPDLTDEDRAELRKSTEEAPWMLRPMLRGLAEDPESVRARLFTTMPRVFFAMLPVFAAILALFYRGRRFPTHLVFAAHVHAFAFAALTLSEAVKFTRNDVVQAVVGLAMVLILLGYGLRALKAVYGGGWVRTVAKAAGIGFIYLVASIPAFMIILTWAAISL